MILKISWHNFNDVDFVQEKFSQVIVPVAIAVPSHPYQSQESVEILTWFGISMQYHNATVYVQFHDSWFDIIMPKCSR
jgi:hypothetical protein